MFIKPQEEFVKLINPRGRIISVKRKEVEKLLARGFLNAPPQPHEYNPVFDRTEIVNTPHINLQNPIWKFRKVLMVEKI